MSLQTAFLAKPPAMIVLQLMVSVYGFSNLLRDLGFFLFLLISHYLPGFVDGSQTIWLTLRFAFLLGNTYQQEPSDATARHFPTNPANVSLSDCHAKC